MYNAFFFSQRTVLAVFVALTFLFSLSHVQVNFSYVEAGEQKQALVKLVACKRLVSPLFRDRICLEQFLTIIAVLSCYDISLIKLFHGPLSPTLSFLPSFCSSKHSIGYLA